MPGRGQKGHLASGCPEARWGSRERRGRDRGEEEEAANLLTLDVRRRYNTVWTSKVPKMDVWISTFRVQSL